MNSASFLFSMKTILDALCDSGLSEAESQKALQIVFEWVDEQYPVLATLARNTVMKDLVIKPEQQAME